MKKAITILMLLAVTVSFVSCGGRGDKETTVPSVIPHAERETVTVEQKPNESGIAVSGENAGLIWTLFNDGALEISGNGKWEANPEVLAYAQQIKKVTFGNGVNAVGQAAFKDCENLKEIILPESMQLIEAEAFSGCGIKALNLGKNVALIYANAFDECELTDIKVSTENPYYSTDRYGVIFNKEKTVLVLYSDGFKMNSYTVPNTVESIGENAFLGNERLVSVELPETLREIGAKSFFECENLKDIKLPSQMTLIGASAFENCSSLKEPQFPETIQVIGDSAFAGCTGIEKISLPKSVNTIGTGAFAETVEEVYYAGSKTSWAAVWVGENAFVNASVYYGEKSAE